MSEHNCNPAETVANAIVPLSARADSHGACPWPGPTPTDGKDAFGRTIDYLRVSVTDRCDERCLYCMPEGYRGWTRRPDHLSAEEILRVVRVAAGIGFRKFRLTGGEPLVRSDLVAIVRGMAATAGVETIGISTNGTALGQRAADLRSAGVRTVNISLDALDPAVYRRITGGDIERVLAGIRAAVAVGFERVKLNAVLLRGMNEDQIWPLVLFAAEHKLPLRFIELMPVSQGSDAIAGNFLPVSEVMERLRSQDSLVPQLDPRIGHGPAKYYRLERTGAMVGFIGALTNQHFCDTCNRVRLTADGQVRPCLGRHAEVDLRSRLRDGASDADLATWLAWAVRQKPGHHGLCEPFAPVRPMTAVGG